MSYRDDLAAAHARIQALEDELARKRDEGEASPAWSAEKTQLVADLEAARRDGAQLSRDLEAARRETLQVREELARVRQESAGFVERIRFLQDERTKRQQERPAAPSNKPVILDRGAQPVCPHCQKTGHVVTLLRDAELTPSVCPQCAAITLLR